MSRVRGGHNFYQMRVSDKEISASRGPVDILVALDSDSISSHSKELSAIGVVVYDSAALKEKHDGSQFFDVPLLDLALKNGGDKIMVNTVATGTVLGMLGLGTDIFLDILREILGKKGEAVLSANANAARAGHEFAGRECLRCEFSTPAIGTKKMLIGINEAVGLGALASGCKFYSAYPMTPSTGIMLYIASKAKEFEVIVEQAEDEIAAINMALGASFAGIRAMTGTSGGGFALMVEGLSLAAMTETPIVIALAQRPGPATGLPTRTEQGDLLFALHAGHGEFLSDHGISPSARPGTARHLVVTDSDEHDEDGHLIEDAATRVQMVDKRLFRKMPLIRSEITPPVFYGNSRPDIILTGWGSTYGIMKEAVNILSETTKVAMLHFSEIFPFPSSQELDYLEILGKANMTIIVEQNASSQFARLMKAETGFEFTGKINRYDGRPFLVEELLGEISAYIG